MRRMDFPDLKRCTVCDLLMPRKRYGKAKKLETPGQYRERQTCGRKRCQGVQAERTRAEVCRAIRPTPDVTLLRAIAEENRLVVAQCSRCSEVFIKPAGGRASLRTRCDYCRRNGGSTKVGCIRGFTPYEAQIIEGGLQ